MTPPELQQAVILAGGRGTRLGSMTDNTPKPLVLIHGRPFLGHLLEQLKQQGFQEVLVLVGYLAGQIREYCGDGSHWGLRVRYVESPLEAETGQRIRDAAPLLEPHFLLMYCDNYWPMQLPRMWDAFQQGGTPAMLTVYSNHDGTARNNVQMDENGYVTAYDPIRTMTGLNGVEIGYSILSRQVLDHLPADNVTFSHAVYPSLAANGLLRAFETGHRYYSIGSMDRLPVTEAFLKPQRAVILDRDGTLNERPPQAQYVKSWDEFRWLPGAIEALKLLKKAGYTLILASNQPGIGRSIMTENDLEWLHTAMQNDLARHGVALDAIYHCPHGWDDGCLCRKPLPGLLFRAQQDFHLNLTNTMFIGDDPRDRQAGEAAGCITDLVSEDRPLLKVVKDYLATDVSRVS